MIDILLYIVAFVVAIGILVTVHEFGHFWVARQLGIKVLRFSIGFGAPLWKRRFGRDKTELVIAAVPLGGYVKMLDENEGTVPTRERKRAFNRQPIWKRIAVVVAGPMFNFLFAVLAYWFIYMVGVDSIKPVVGRVLEGSIAQQSGFRVGDEILAIDGKPVQTWDQRRLYLFESAIDHRVVTVDVRNPEGHTESRTIDLTNFPLSEVGPLLVERGIGLVGHYPKLAPVIGEVNDGPGKRAGMQPGDRIRSVNGIAVDDWVEFVKYVNARAGEKLHVEIERDGKLLPFDVTPEAVPVEGRTIGRLNVAGPQLKRPPIPPEMRATMRLGVGEALVESVSDTWAMSRFTLVTLYRILVLEISAKNISGALTIAQVAGETAKVGVDQFVLFLALVSISLGVLNLLPVPVLDGGHLLFYLIEAVKGSPLSEKVMLAAQRVGIALLLALMTLALYNDITRLFH